MSCPAGLITKITLSRQSSCFDVTRAVFGDNSAVIKLFQPFRYTVRCERIPKHDQNTNTKIAFQQLTWSTINLISFLCIGALEINSLRMSV